MVENSFWGSFKSGFSDFTDGVGDFFKVGATLSPSSNMMPDDVIKTKSALNAVGSYAVPDFGITDIPDTKMIDGLKNFQANNGLKVDGIMKPGGPTENALGKALVNKGVSPSDLLDTVMISPIEQPSDWSKGVVGEPSTAKPTLPPTKPSEVMIKPKTLRLPKIDPVTGLTDPLASVPKGKMPSKKQWEEVAKMQQPAMSKSTLSDGQSVQDKLQAMMRDPQYAKNPDYVKHVQDQFKKTYSGEVRYDETGRMIQPTPVIAPDQVELYNVMSDQQNGDDILIGNSGDDDLSGDDQQKDVANHSMDFEGMAERPTHYSKQNEQMIQEKRNTGREEDAFADMQNILMKDGEGFEKFSQENRAAYHAYQNKRRQNWRPERTVHDEQVVKRNAIEASRVAAAPAYIVPEAKRAFYNNAADVAHGAVMLSDGDPEKLKQIEETRQRKMKENFVPEFAEGKTIGKYADDVANLNLLTAGLSGAGKAAKELQKMGVSKDGQRVGALLTGLVGFVGKDGAKLGASEIKNYLAQKFGKNWSKRLMPKDVEVLNDLLVEQGLQVGVGAGLQSIGKNGQDTRQY